MNVCLDITKEFNSLVNYDYFFDGAPMYPVIFLNLSDDISYCYEFDLMNFGLNISNGMEQIFLENEQYFGDIIRCSYEYKRLLIYGKAHIKITRVKGVSFRYGHKGEYLYYGSPCQVKKGDFNYKCGGFSCFSEHFVLLSIIADCNAHATISFSSENYFLMSSASQEFENMASNKQTPFKYENNNIFNEYIKKFSKYPEKMFDANFIRKHFEVKYDNGFNTLIAVKDEKIE